MTSHLHPPLSWIEAGLFRSEVLAADHAAESLSVPPSESVDSDSVQEEHSGFGTERLELLMGLLERAQVVEREDLPVSPGQIRRLKLARLPLRPVHLLITRVGPLLAHGWLVVSETDYASDTDWVLQEDDVIRPLSAGLAVVQLWNHRQVPLAVLAGSVNEVNEQTLQGMLLVAGRVMAPGRPQVSPLHSLVSDVELDGVEFVTGAPLVPGARWFAERQTYRDLYDRWAEQMVASQLPSLGLPVAGERKPGGQSGEPSRNTVQRPAQLGAAANMSRWKALALASMAALAVIVSWPLMQSDAEPEAERYRSVLPSGLAASVLEVHLAPEVTVQQLTTQLNRWSAQVASGPDETGAYRLLVPQTLADEALRDLQAAPWVEKVQLREKP